MPSPQEWHYRNTVQFVPGIVGPDGRPVAAGRRGDGGSRLLCFQRAHSHVPVPVEHCYISDETINRAIHDAPWAALPDETWAALRGIMVRVVPGQALQVTLVSERPLQAPETTQFASAARAALPGLAGLLQARARGGGAQVIWGDGSLMYDLADCRLEVPAGAFVQVNLGAAERLVALALDWLEPAPHDVALDAYAGVGTFSLPLAKRAGSVIAVEHDREAAGALARNAAAGGAYNVAAQAQPVEQAIPRLKGSVDLVVLDPPRRGCPAEVLAAVAGLAPRRIAYVSCEPSTLARDVRLLGDAGYHLVRSRVVDLFPQTYHLESVSLLEKA